MADSKTPGLLGLDLSDAACNLSDAACNLSDALLDDGRTMPSTGRRRQQTKEIQTEYHYKTRWYYTWIVDISLNHSALIVFVLNLPGEVLKCVEGSIIKGETCDDLTLLLEGFPC